MRTLLSSSFIALTALVAPVGAAQAQAPAVPAPAAEAPADQAPGAAAPNAPAEVTPPLAAPADGPAAPEGYAYQADGRRDPFLNLRASGAAPALPAKRGDGPAGMASDEIAVRGVLKSRGSLIAMVQGPDRKTYVVHQGDTLMDGTVKAIIPEGLVIIQQINDPLSLVKQREIRKLLRSAEEAKE